jgi:hypothetical protein
MKTTSKTTDYSPVTGGADLAKYVRDDVATVPDLKVDSDLDRHIVRLLTLHPQLQVRFRSHDLARLDDATKQALLQDMNDLLGIKPLRAGRTCSL